MNLNRIVTIFRRICTRVTSKIAHTISRNDVNQDSPYCYFFGYGSLMYLEGLNDHDMHHLYSESELYPCELRGYERGMSMAYRRRRYYGLVENPKCSVFGICFKVYSAKEFERLLLSEGAHSAYASTPEGKAYDVVDISDKVVFHTKSLGADDSIPIFTLLSVAKNIKDADPNIRYIEDVWYGVKSTWDALLVHKMVETGLIDPSKY